MKYWDGVGPGRPTDPGSQLEAVLGEVRRLEEAATRNEEELERSGLGPEGGQGPGLRLSTRGFAEATTSDRTVSPSVPRRRSRRNTVPPPSACA